MSFSDAAQFWNQRFATDELLFGSEPNQYLREHVDVWRRDQRVLCVADGEGRNSVWLAQQGMKVTAFDLAALGVAKARSLAAGAGVDVDFNISDCDAWPWDAASYDGVAAIFVQFADPPMRQRLFDGIERTLRPGGTLILQGYTPKQLDYGTGGPPQVENLYTEEQLRAELAPLAIHRLDVYEAEVAEGSGHQGRSALVGVVASKTT